MESKKYEPKKYEYKKKEEPVEEPVEKPKSIFWRRKLKEVKKWQD